MEGDKYQALASNSVSQERRKFEMLVMEASSNPGWHQDFVDEILPLLSETLHFLACKYFGRENPFKGNHHFIEWLCQTYLHLVLIKTLSQGLLPSLFL